MDPVYTLFPSLSCIFGAVVVRGCSALLTENAPECEREIPVKVAERLLLNARIVVYATHALWATHQFHVWHHNPHQACIPF
jgi:hypothetical protein